MISGCRISQLICCCLLLPFEIISTSLKDLSFFQELRYSPLGKNAFFIRMLGDQFQHDGIELNSVPRGENVDLSLQSCEWIGSLQCDEGFDIRCQGTGLVDCTGNCPGDEFSLEVMLSQITEPEFRLRYPALYTKLWVLRASQKGLDQLPQIVNSCHFKSGDSADVLRTLLLGKAILGDDKIFKLEDQDDEYYDQVSSENQEYISSKNKTNPLDHGQQKISHSSSSLHVNKCI